MLEKICTSQMQIVQVFKDELNKWENGIISEDELKEKIAIIVKLNKEIIYKDQKIKSIIKQRLGKKRIRMIESILKQKGKKNE